MTKRVIQNQVILRGSDFDIPSATRAYPIGLALPVVDENSATTKPYASVYEYHQAAEALQQYGVYAIKNTGSGVVVGLTTSPATAGGYFRVIVPQTAVTAGSYFWGAVEGLCTAAHTAGAGVNMTAGNLFKLANAATTLTAQTVSQATATTPTNIRAINSVGFSTGLSATSANISVYLMGDPIVNNYPVLQ